MIDNTIGNQTKYYRIGGIVFRMDAPDFPAAGFQEAFRVEPCTPDVTYTVRAADTLTRPDAPCIAAPEMREFYRTGDAVVRLFLDEWDSTVLISDTERGNHHDVLIRRDKLGCFSRTLALKLMNLPRAVIPFGGVFLHASFINRNGEAVLFTAPKQTGKSTQARLWETYRGTQTVNGDRALLRRQGETWYAYGSPYCGTSGICTDAALPLRAVVLLSQGKENTAARASARRAFSALLDGCSFDTWDKEQMTRLTDLFGSLITSVPFYTLSCRPDVGAVEALEALL